MNYRYLIKKLNGKKIIERTLLSRSDESTPVINQESSKSIVMGISTQEESAMFYQLAKTIYEMEGHVSSFDDDRSKYKTDDYNAIRKINYLLLDELIYIDFSGVFTTKNKLKLTKNMETAKRIFKQGIKLHFNNKEVIHFLPFHKSGSMGRQSVVSFIRAERKELLDIKLNFDLIFEDKKYSLSKLQAYQGLYLSNGIRVEGLDLNDESVIIVPDYNKLDSTEFYTTAISKALLKEMIHSICFDDREESDWQYNTLVNMILSKKKPDDPFNETTLNNLLLNIRNNVIKSKQSLEHSLDDAMLLLDNLNREQYFKIIENISIFFGLSRLNEDEFVTLEHVRLKTKTNIFDGLGFIDKSLLEELNRSIFNRDKEPFHHSIQIRLPYTKGMLHALDFKSWFSESNIKEIRDIFGNLRDVSKIKIILTKSQFKCYDWLNDRFKTSIINGDRLAPMRHYFEHFKTYDHALYITNTDQFEDERFETILNYQVLHTPAIEREAFSKLLDKGNHQYIELVSNPQTQFDYFIKSKDFSNQDSKEYVSDSDDDQDILYKMLLKNENLIHDDIFQNRIKSYSNSLLKNMKIGRILIDGTIRFLSGDLLELIVRMTYGSAYSPFGLLLGDSFYAPSSNNHFEEGREYAVLRNPHITSRELVVSKPISKEKNQIREKYFSHLSGVIMLNAFANQMLAMQTADTDGDLVRIIANSSYVEAVKKSNLMDSKFNPLLQLNIVERLYFPSLKGKKENPTKDNLFNSTVASFSTRIGIMSNYALTHSIIAYNENDPDTDKKAFHKVQAEKMSFIIASEIDSVKSGKAPYYRGRSIKNPFIDFKTAIENNRAENVLFDVKDTSPNLYLLKENAERVLEKAKKQRLLYPDDISFKIFDFEDDPNWSTSLNQELLKEISKRIIAYRDWNKSIRYTSNSDELFSSTILKTLYFILSIQYDDQEMPIVLENLLIKLMDIDLDHLIATREKLLAVEWQYFLDDAEKDSFVENHFPDILDENEKALIFNFSNSGHKILYLILSHIIFVQQNMLEEGFKDFDTIRRYKSLISKIIERQNLKGKIDIDDLIEQIITKNLTPLKLMKTFIDPHMTKGASDYRETNDLLKKLSAHIRGFKKTSLDYTFSDIEEIGRIFDSYIASSRDSSGVNLPQWLMKSNVKNEINKDLDVLFNRHNVDRSQEIKYYYALRTLDSSLGFMLTVGTSHLMDHIKPNQGGFNNAK